MIEIASVLTLAQLSLEAGNMLSHAVGRTIFSEEVTSQQELGPRLPNPIAHTCQTNTSVPESLRPNMDTVSLQTTVKTLGQAQAPLNKRQPTMSQQL